MLHRPDNPDDRERPEAASTRIAIFVMIGQFAQKPQSFRSIFPIDETMQPELWEVIGLPGSTDRKWRLFSQIG